MNRFFWLSCCLCLSLGCSKGDWSGFQKQKPDLLVRATTDAQIIATVKDVAGNSSAPGIVFSLYRGAPSMHTQASVLLEIGHADEQKSRPISAKDHFRIASISKSFLGYIALKLIEEGQLEPSDSLYKYVPSAPLASEVTIDDLAYMQSGIPNNAVNQDFQRAVEGEPTKYWTIQELLEYTNPMLFAFEPGRQWQYSNTNSVYLGMVIEAVTGITVEEALQTYVFEPLSLLNTGVDTSGLPLPHPSSYRYTNASKPFKYGRDWMDQSHWNASWAGASGNMYSTEFDLAVFGYNLFSGKLLDSSSQQRLVDWRDTGDHGWQYGFHVWDYFGAQLMLGDIHGFSSFLAYVPESDITFVVLANLSNEQNKYSPAYNVGIAVLDAIYQLD
ncbi:MAG: serine hydrolase domain-containing protein [Pseudomonadota bacterium]